MRASDTVNKNIKIVYLTSAAHTDFASGLAPDYVVRKGKQFADGLAQIVANMLHNTQRSGIPIAGIPYPVKRKSHAILSP